MSTTQLPVIQGPGFHEIVDAFKYALLPEEKRFTVMFRLGDNGGALTGLAEPVFSAMILGLEHTVGYQRTLLVTAILSLEGVRNSPTWRIEKDEYRYAPASAREGNFNLRRIH